MTEETKTKETREEEEGEGNRMFLPKGPEMFDKRYSLGLTNPFDRFNLSAPESPISEAKKRGLLETNPLGLKKRNSDDLSVGDEDQTRPKKRQDSAELRRRGMVWGEGIPTLDEEKVLKVEEENKKLQRQIDELKRLNAEQQKKIEILSSSGDEKVEEKIEVRRIIRRQSVQMAEGSMPPPSDSIKTRRQSVQMTDSSPSVSSANSRRQSIQMTEESVEEKKVEKIEQKVQKDEEETKKLELLAGSTQRRSSKEIVRPSRSEPNLLAPLRIVEPVSPPSIFSEVPEFIEYEQNHNEETVIHQDNGSIIVQAGTLSQLVNRLFGFRSIGNYCKEFLLTYRYFTSSESLLQLFEDKMNFKPKDKEDADEVRYYEMNKEALLKKFSIILTWWIEINKDEVMRDPKLSLKWNSLVQRCPNPSSILPKPADSGRRRMTFNRGEKSKSQWFTRSGKTTVSFSDISPKELAEQLCLHEMELFKGITLEQLKCENWYKDQNREKNAADVHKFTNWFNNWSYRMAQEILQKTDQKHRVSAIKNCIKLGVECKELNNFNALMEVIACLNIGPIARLKKTWKEVPEKYINQFNEISQVMEAVGNFKAYRSELSKAHRPMIPYLGLTLKDFVVIEDANPTVLTNGYINFDKMRMLSNGLTFVIHCQGKEYPFTPNLDVLEYLQHNTSELLSPLLSPEQLMELSYTIEPSKFNPNGETTLSPPPRVGSHSLLEKIAKVVSPTIRHSIESSEITSASEKKKNWRKSHHGAV
eukprot:TRINITY_DN1197_c0_g1_i1.p1 TRINITY_DN1197_c0_g1~~TRINITY_DN1197_c0_g1_i1.p1  ORF type:complete len:757 (+),score=260.89 TRINITY_DN1197_c0_g1_i1:94-2364(+)